MEMLVLIVLFIFWFWMFNSRFRLWLKREWEKRVNPAPDVRLTPGVPLYSEDDA
jgi:hypothetical protein